MAALVAWVAVATGLLLLLQAVTGIRTDNISSQSTRYTRLLLDPRVVNHSATSANLLPGKKPARSVFYRTCPGWAA